MRKANKSPKNTIFQNRKRNGKAIRNPFPGLDHHEKLTTSRGSPLANAYHVWSTSITAIVSYPAHRTTKRTITLLRQRWRRNKQDV